MYCRLCGALLNDNTEICVKCGCRPLNGNKYCQECGVETTEKQEMCIKCGCRLKTSIQKSSGSILEGIDVGGSSGNQLHLNFSGLKPYYQEEFQKIYDSGESYKGKFNWCGFFFGSIWALTKGCWLAAIVAIVASFMTAGLAGFIYWILFGFRGNYMYYCAYVKNKQCIL